MKTSNENILLIAEEAGVSLLANWTSRPLWVGNTVNYAIQAVYTGTPNGTFRLQGCNDEGQISAMALSVVDDGLVNWSNIDESAIVVIAAGNLLYNAQDVGYRWVRLAWTDTSSSNPSTLTVCRFNGKGS